jgi:FHS family L-fucose permease-like MFS transporter
MHTAPTSPSNRSTPLSRIEERSHLIPPGRMLPFVLVTLLFFIWGMSNNLTDILVQQFKKSFELSWVEAQLVQTATFLGYFFMAIPAALLMRRWGYKTGILVGLILFGTGTLLFWPAAVVGKYAPFLVALFMVGCGSSVLETAANPFIAQFGPSATSERRLNLSQAFNPPGTMFGVLIGKLFIFSGIELSASTVLQMKSAGTYNTYLHGEIMRVVPTYVGLSAVVFLLAVIIGRTAFPPIHRENEDEPADVGDHGSFAALLHYPQLILAVVAQFFYVGAQVATWSNLIPYLKQYSVVSERQAANFLLATLVALGLGRVISTWLMRYVAPGLMMGIYSVINIALLAVAIFHPGLIGGYMIVLTSFFMSIMFPTIFALGVKGLGPNTKLGGSLIVMSIVGGAIFPPVLGVIARVTGGSLALGYLLPAAGYVVVALYGFLGAKLHGDIPPPLTDPDL